MGGSLSRRKIEAGTKNNGPRQRRGPQKNIPGGDLLSHEVTLAVPSAQKGLTAVFGMGTGVSPSLQPPENQICKRTKSTNKTKQPVFDSCQNCLDVKRAGSALLNRVSDDRIRRRIQHSNSIGQAERPISTGQLRALQRLTPPAYQPGNLPGVFRDTSSRGGLHA